jgi:hypothetical protein
MKRIFFGLFFLLVWNSSLHAQTSFYQGKTITLAGDREPGRCSRAHSQHWGSTGNPDIIVHNMGPLRSRQTISYRAADLTITSIIPPLLPTRRTQRAGSTTPNLIGSAAWTAQTTHLYAPDTPFKTIYDAGAPCSRPRNCHEPARSATTCQNFK